MAESITTYGLDACALIAYLREEEGGSILKMLLTEPDKRFVWKQGWVFPIEKGV